MDLFGLKKAGTAAAATAVGGVLESAGKAAKDIRAAITGKSVIDEEAQAQLEIAQQELETRILEAQAKINEAEAASASVFVSGWRPALAWLCVVAFSLNYLVFPLIRVFGVEIVSIEDGQLWPMITTMLGLGAYRSYEKTKGIARQ